MAETTDERLIRRLEDATINSWPGAFLVKDGAWLLRLTPGHPSRRANSLSVLDPADGENAGQRLAAMMAASRRLGMAPIARWTPLMPAELDRALNAAGFRAFEETRVLTVPLALLPAGDVGEISLLEAEPAGRGAFADMLVSLGGEEPQLRDLLTAILGRIALPAVLAVARHEGQPVAAALTVIDGPLAGIFEVITLDTARRAGHATRAIRAAFASARARGATTGWLQVKTANTAAAGAYARLGFTEAYRYHYRRLPD